MRTTRAAILLALVAAPALGAGLAPTPSDMLGPFYPDVLPQDTDEDLVQIRGAARPAVGQVLELVGRVTDTNGQPLAGVRLELWQTDAHGRYIHSGDPEPARRDPGFQGFGVALTDAMGRYRFRTVVPGGYWTRPPHHHIRLLIEGQEVLVTQLYHPGRTREPGIGGAALSSREAAQTLRLRQGERLVPVGEFDFIIDLATPRPRR
ncbi:MAG: intradiol ring-cleavage dioxygenase [Rhodocyclaceae bacterium]|nr:intradiol ring-cleavage dioxygenase [Rhodocyclaceae bacterium]